MGWLLWYCLPYDGDEVRYVDTPEEALEVGNDIQASYPFQDISLGVYKVEKEFSLSELQEHLNKNKDNNNALSHL